MGGRAGIEEDLVEKYRNHGDELADATLRSVFDHGGISGVAKLLNEIIDLDRLKPDDTDQRHGPQYGHFLRESIRVPEGYQPDKMAASVDWFNSYGWTAFSILGCASLPEGYAVAEVTEVLNTTQAMETHTQRRLWETVQYVLDVMEPTGLEVDPDDAALMTGKAVWRTQKVRLFHATIRFMLTYDATKANRGKPDTDPIPYGELLIKHPWVGPGTPINQAQMTGTVYSFSFVVLRGLRDLGYGDRISREMEEAFLYRWNVAGQLMGTLPELLVETYDDAEELWNHLRRPTPTEGGRRIMASLVDFMESQVPWYLFFLRPTARMMIVQLVGEQHARETGLELTTMQKLWFGPVKLMMAAWAKFYGHSGAAQGASRWLYKRMRRNMIGKGRSGPRVFEMPISTPSEEAWLRG